MMATCPLGSVVSINPDSVGKNYPYPEIEYIDISSVGSGTLEGKTQFPISEAPSRAKRLVKEGDTILSTVRPNRRSFLYIKHPVPNLIVSTGFAVLRPSEKIDSRFLFYAVTEQKITDYLTANAKGAAYPAVDTETIARAQINLPSIETQRKIASILSAYDDLIENNTRRIKILEEMAQMIYREWFVKFLFSGHEKVKMVDSAMGVIPEGWEVVPVTKSVEINPRTTVSKTGEKPFVPMGSLANNSMLITNVESRTGNSGSKFKNGDTLFARITPCLENGKTGYVQFLPSEKDVAFGSTEFIVLRSKTLCPEYVYLMSRSEEFRDNAIKSMSGATGRQRVSDKCFEQYFVAQPDSMTLDRFTEHVSSMFKAIHNLASRNDNLRQTRDLLLPRLVSGVVDVEGLAIAKQEETS